MNIQYNFTAQEYAALLISPHELGEGGLMNGAVDSVFGICGVLAYLAIQNLIQQYGLRL